MKLSSANPDADAQAAPPELQLTEAHFINRELSWLAFNERVLEEAERADLPLLERVKFLAITASNLDEFFMVRVGGLQYVKDQGRKARDDAGLTASQQLDAIQERAKEFVARQYKVLNEQLAPALRQHGIRRLRLDEITPAQKTFLEEFYMQQVHPVLSPIGVDDSGPTVMLKALEIALLCRVTRTEESGEETGRLVLLTVPSSLSRIVMIPDSEPGQFVYIHLEDLLQLQLPHFFPEEHVASCARFRLSRNGDIAVDDESAIDLAIEMEEILEARLISPTIRIEIEEGAPRDLQRVLREWFGAKGAQIYVTPGELDLRSYFHIADLPGYEQLKVEPWDAQSCPDIMPGESIFDAIKRQDILLHHPFETFEPVLALIEEAAADPNVVAIKQILYRTAKNSRVISALIKAAEAGKHVTVLVELKARFDEARNLERAEELMHAGAQIIYGVRGLKSHAKICLVMRREAGRMTRYMHFGTGNYNEATSRIYTDISYLTCRADYGTDASAFFNTVTGRSRFMHFEKISMAPFDLRSRIVALIRSETERARQGETARIVLKMNALEDREMITALYEASHAGVIVRLNVRGICCLRPGIKGLSENIRVVSIIDRYLEHARVFYFRQGGRPAVLISSADFMTRNLSKRVELLTPIEDSAAKKRLIHILDTHFADTLRARVLQPDGTYTTQRATGTRKLRSQEIFTREAAERARQKAQPPDVLVPHLPKG